MSRVVKEGGVTIVVPDGVFYNRLAEFTRSVGVAVVAYESIYKGRMLSIIDALAASGVRGLRYVIESGSIERAILNDKSVRAYEAIVENIKLNNCVNCEAYNLDATLLLRLLDGFDFIDIDPFGSPSEFIDVAVSRVSDGGIVAVTATDLTALCGLYPRSGFRKYAAIVRRTYFHREMALRVLIRALVEAAGRHSRAAYPILSHLSEQYARVYVRVVKGKRVYPHLHIGYLVVSRDSVEVYSYSDFSEAIGRRVVDGYVVGPLWIGPLHDKEFIRGMIKGRIYEKVGEEGSRRRLFKHLSIFYEEADYPPYYLDVHRFSEALKVPPPPVNEVISKLRSIGYNATRVHLSPYGIKTNAPVKEVISIISS